MKFHTLRYFIICIIIISFACSNESNNTEGDPIKKNEKIIVDIDLDRIKKRDTLKAITIFGPTSYFLYRGQAMGFEYELLEDIASQLDLKLALVVSKNIDSVFSLLNSGKGDLIAYGLTITSSRKEIIDFTIPYSKSFQVLVQRKPDNWKQLSYKEKQKALISDVTDLGGETIAVRENSSYVERIKNLSEEIGDSIGILVVPGELSTYEIIEKVSEGEYEYTLADNNIAELNQSFYKNIDVSLAASLSQNIAWATRKSSPELKAMLDSMLESYIGSAKFNIIYDKYFGSSQSFKKRVSSEYYSQKTGKISPYDDLIKKYSRKIDWDWILLSSVIYQESQFDPNAGSWAGAHGLMQLMPKTAEGLGVKNTANPEQSIQGGSKYLAQLYHRFDQIPDSIQRLKFTLASYNCGYGHVVDAQKLAEADSLDPLQWDKNVDIYILKLAKPKYYNKKNVNYGYVRGSEPYNYVKDIFARYEEYKVLLAN